MTPSSASKVEYSRTVRRCSVHLDHFHRVLGLGRIAMGIESYVLFPEP